MYHEESDPAGTAGFAVRGAGGDLDDAPLSARSAAAGGRGDDAPLSALQRAALDYPALYPFGTGLYTFLDAEGEKDAPFEARLRSSWRYIVGRVQRFARTFKPREAAVLDVEDVVHSVAARLVEKDHLWDWRRGRYSTFVEAVMISVLANCHEKARAVSGPTNSYSRMKKYHERRALGTMTRSMAATLQAIECVMGDFDSWDETIVVPGPDDDVDVQAIVAALRALENPLDVWILVRKNGLLGNPRLTIKEIAAQLGITGDEVKGILKAALIQVATFLKAKQPP